MALPGELEIERRLQVLQLGHLGVHFQTEGDALSDSGVRFPSGADASRQCQPFQIQRF